MWVQIQPSVRGKSYTNSQKRTIPMIKMEISSKSKLQINIVLKMVREKLHLSVIMANGFNIYILNIGYNESQST